MIGQILLPAVESIASKDGGRECLAYERHSCGLPTRCWPVSSFGSDNLKWPGTLENVAKGEICLKLKRRFEVGTGLALELPDHNGKDTYTVLAKIVHVSRQDASDWFLICRFISELSDDEVEWLLRQSSRSDDRIASSSEVELPLAVMNPSLLAEPARTDLTQRRLAEVVRVHLSIEIAPCSTIGCVVPDFGANCGWPLREGVVGMLRGKRAKGIPWKLKVKVRTCRYESEEWKLDCRLITRPSQGELHRAISGLVLGS